jgi:hypothetical protein
LLARLKVGRFIQITIVYWDRFFVSGQATLKSSTEQGYFEVYRSALAFSAA